MNTGTLFNAKETRNVPVIANGETVQLDLNEKYTLKRCKEICEKYDIKAFKISGYKRSVTYRENYLLIIKNDEPVFEYENSHILTDPYIIAQ